MLSLPTAVPLAVDLVLPLLVGVVSAALVRSWWALLIVPVAFRVGFVLVSIPLAGAFDVLARSSPEGTIESLGILVGLELVPVALGIAICTPIEARAATAIMSKGANKESPSGERRTP